MDWFDNVLIIIIIILLVLDSTSLVTCVAVEAKTNCCGVMEELLLLGCPATAATNRGGAVSL